MNSFKEFVDKSGRRAKKELGVVKKVLEQAKMKVVDFTDDEDPYIFVYSPDDGLSFDGVRIYKIGEQLAFRVQREAKTHPYGAAYGLDIKEMWQDLLSDNMDEQEAGKAVMEAIVGELKNFFKKSAHAEKDLRASEIDKERGDSLGRIAIKSTGTDYSNMIFNKGN
jgi:hypothetical protein